MCGNLILTESRAIGSFYFIFLIYTIIWTLSLHTLICLLFPVFPGIGDGFPLTYPDSLTFFYFSGYRRQFSSYIPRFAYFFLFSRVWATVSLLHTLICLLFPVFPGIGDGFPLTYPDSLTFFYFSGYRRRFSSCIP